jgi:oligoendopeptidase F
MKTDAAPLAKGTRWELDRLIASADMARADLAVALDRCRAFAESYRGTIATLDGPGLGAMLAELAQIDNDLSRVSSYAHLRESIDVESQENRDLTTEVDQAMVEAGNLLRFAELEWTALPDDVALRLADAPEVAKDRHYLIAQRRYAAHLLSEPEEQMLSERHTAAVSAWQALFGRITSTLQIPFDAGQGEDPHTIDRLLALVRNPDRDLRLRSMATLFEGLAPHADTLAHCYDTLVGDRLVMDRLRNYSDPMAATHLRNELPQAAVDRMLERVEAAYPIAQRWFRLKAKLLGLDRLHLADQYAPLGDARPLRYPEARSIVEGAFNGFAPRVAAVAAEIMGEGRLDAEPRVGKRGGAFCAPVAQDAPVYVLMNFNDRFTDVMTLAHELGHAMHFALAAERQSPLSAYTGIALAEVPSTFAESIALDYVLAREDDAATRRTLFCEHVEGTFASVFRQAVLTRYEQRAYAARAAGQTLTAERLGEIWIEENRRYYGDAVEVPEGYRTAWAYIPHFISTRFYTYAYVFASLVALNLRVEKRRDADAFVGPYLEFLEAGASDGPVGLLKPLGVDLNDPDVWEPSMAELDRLVSEAEALAIAQ